MARPPRIFWLASLAIVAYLLWRWRARREVEAFLPPAPPPAAPPNPSPAAALGADASGTPRRILTRVHRGAPPSMAAMADRAKQAAANVTEQVREVAENAVAAGTEAFEQAQATLGAAVDQAKEKVAEVAGEAQEKATDVAEQATEVVEQGQEKAAEVAEQAQEKATDVAEQVTEAAEQAKEKAAEVAEQAQEKATDVAEQAREVAANVGSSRAVGDAADAVRTLAASVTPDAVAEPSGSVNVNTADLDTLIALPGIGAVIAERIVRYRTKNGPFRSIEELTEVPGIGARNLKTFRHLLTV